jgi:hypothetical protein
LGGQLSPNSRLKPEGSGEPVPVHCQASRAVTENPLRTFKRHNQLQDEVQYLKEREYQAHQSEQFYRRARRAHPAKAQAFNRLLWAVF